jgi:hypothetical protein
MEKKEMGGACSEYGGQIKSVHIGGETCRKEDNLEDIGVDGRIILKFRGLSWGVGNGLIGLRIWTDIWLL